VGASGQFNFCWQFGCCHRKLGTCSGGQCGTIDMSSKREVEVPSDLIYGDLRSYTER
jgi:hypothetical protein